MQETLDAVASRLSSDATLQSLGVVSSSIYDEGNMVAGEVDYPAISITSQGDKPYDSCTRVVSVETMTIRVFDQKNGYYRINQICARIRELFHRQPLDVSGQYLGVNDVTWVWTTPQYYDPKFLAENRGVRFRITYSDFNPAYDQ